jgi:predicted DNA-binding mobile mystery protein A
LNFNDLSFIQINRRLEELRVNKDKSNIRGGWINYMRTALGMSLETLAKLSDSSKSAIHQAEQREIEGKVTISTLKKYAEAMDCELVYFFAPKDNLETLIKNKAYEKARRSLLTADLHMKLEDQKVEGDMQKQIERLAQKLIEDGEIW